MKLKKAGLDQPGQTTLFLHAVVLHKIPKLAKSGGEVMFLIKQAGTLGSASATDGILQAANGWMPVSSIGRKITACASLVSAGPTAYLEFGERGVKTCQVTSIALMRWFVVGPLLKMRRARHLLGRWRVVPDLTPFQLRNCGGRGASSPM